MSHQLEQPVRRATLPLKVGSLRKIDPPDDRQTSTRESKRRKMTFLPRTDKRQEREPPCAEVMNSKGMIELVAEKGRRFNEALARHELRAGWVQRNLINDPHFNACLSSFLGKLVARQELTADLKNIQKGTFESIETVVCNRLDKLLKMNSLIQGYESRETGIEGLLEERLRILKQRIRL